MHPGEVGIQAILRNTAECPEPQVLLYRELTEDAAPLGYQGHSEPRDILGRHAHDRATAHSNITRSNANSPHDGEQRGRLARAVRANQSDGLPRRQRELEPPYSVNGTVADLEALNFESQISHRRWPAHVLVAPDRRPSRRGSPGSRPVCRWQWCDPRPAPGCGHIPP